MKRVLIIGGVHGDEIGGVMIARELKGWLQGKGIDGVDVIPEVNLQAIENRERAHPTDGKDLNRSFPGDPDGTVSDRLAYDIFQKAKNYDCVIDLHTYGVGGRCIPYMLTDLKKEYNVELCKQVGLDNAVQTGGTGKQLFLEISDIGIPSLIIEAGGAGWLRGELETVTKALKNFIDGEPPGEVRFFDSYIWVPIEEAGHYIPKVSPGTEVKEGDVLGHLDDLPIRSPTHGLVLGIKMDGPCEPPEENIASIAEI